uniref:Phytanoyl-CoA dioxygenase n=1 Tax=uncultured marine thaumarchaeote KM3_02_B09 TaxID=1455956 RepID=A0A075G115_9ARCH|nr:hypothetical protein [uncultured marine thaumarchaeote KM3_02_B09]
MVEAAEVLDVTEPNFHVGKAKSVMSDRGFVILRNLFPEHIVQETVQSAKIWLAQPAVAGAAGYWKVDHPKKILNSFILGGGVVELLLNELVLDIVDSLMEGECVLAETNLKLDRPTKYSYFPLHSDFAAGWSKGPNTGFTLTKSDMQHVLGVGGAIYLHDTTEGAFSYCDGTHRLGSPHGQNLSAYPEQERDQILAKCVRCDGKKGDLVLFDDRGFHGPAQPSSHERLVIIVDYYRVSTFGRSQVSPMPIWSSDIARLSPRQLRAAGAGATYMIRPEDYSFTRFKRSRMYSLVIWLIEYAFILNHLKAELRSWIKKRVGRWV